jgi:surface polysaccharide O-acyltransferase-like enzyme
MRTEPISEHAPATRQYFLDWLRVLAFMLLILYHTGMGYVGPDRDWGWHVKNADLSEGLQWFMLLLNGWRLPLLFLVSGAGVYYALGSRTAARFLGERFRRLFWPVLIGMVGVVVPLQIYYERLFHGQFTGSFWQWWPHTFSGGPYPQGNFSWHHLWFIVYILAYSLLLLPLLAYIRKPAQAALRARIGAVLSKPLALPALMLLFLLVQKLFDFFPTTHNFTWDWANHLQSILMFLLGFCLAAGNVWPVLQQHARTLAILAVVAMGSYYLQRGFYYVQEGPWAEVRRLCWRIGSLLVMPALLANAARYLNFGNRFLRYANESVLPFYIMHQTVTVTLVYYLLPWQAAPLLKFAVVALGTFGISWLLYEGFIRRLNVLRFAFGLKAAVPQSASKKESVTATMGEPA